MFYHQKGFEFSWDPMTCNLSNLSNLSFMYIRSWQNQGIIPPQHNQWSLMQQQLSRTYLVVNEEYQINQVDFFSNKFLFNNVFPKNTEFATQSVFAWQTRILVGVRKNAWQIPLAQLHKHSIYSLLPDNHITVSCKRETFMWLMKLLNWPVLKLEYSGKQRWILWLLISWSLALSGHLQTWYWFWGNWPH